MPRYHFHVFDGEMGPDTDGIELPNWQDARLKAIRYAGEVLRDYPERVTEHRDWRMEVTDDAGLMLFRFDFCAMAAAATQGRH